MARFFSNRFFRTHEIRDRLHKESGEKYFILNETLTYETLLENRFLRSNRTNVEISLYSRTRPETTDVRQNVCVSKQNNKIGWITFDGEYRSGTYFRAKFNPLLFVLQAGQIFHTVYYFIYYIVFEERFRPPIRVQ